VENDNEEWRIKFTCEALQQLGSLAQSDLKYEFDNSSEEELEFDEPTQPKT